MEQLIQQIINGISLGSIYALIALGYTMVYGIIKLINFAHGDIYMLGAYIGYFCMTTLKLGFLPSLIAAMLICTLIGMAVEKIAYKPLRNATRIAVLITAIGVSLFIEYGTMFFVGAGVCTYPEITGLLANAFNLQHGCQHAADNDSCYHNCLMTIPDHSQEDKDWKGHMRYPWTKMLRN